MTAVRVALLERAAAACAILACLTFWLHSERARASDRGAAQQALRDAKARETVWQARYAQSVATTLHDTVRVSHYATRYDSLRDTLWRDPARIHDTVFVKATIAAADSSVRACRQLVASIVPLRTACDSTIRSVTDERDAYHHLYDASRPRWWDRFGANAGVGIPLQAGAIRLVPVVAFTYRVWP